MQINLKEITKPDIEAMDKVYRLNLVNSLSGIKSVNLVGTISKNNITNLAVISSVVHLSSSPALLGFMQRPTTVTRHTYSNIHETGEYSINMVSSSFTDKAHYTSAKFDNLESEFDQCGLTEQFFKESKAPCVAESPLKILLKFEEEYFIKSSRTILMVGSIQSVYLPQNAVDSDGMIDLEGIQAAGVSGLNTYYNLTKIANYPYARVGQFPQNQI
jgi:flavin reductase (DIM6/NTAB) family NADH-FMN oxidoreductase RutF